MQRGVIGEATQTPAGDSRGQEGRQGAKVREDRAEGDLR